MRNASRLLPRRPEGWRSDEWMLTLDTSGGPDACWPTLGYVSVDGYAITYFRDLGRSASMARLALADQLGRAIAPGMHALHHCDNRCCANPAHLYEGTPQDNGRDKAARGRARNGSTKFTLPPVDMGRGFDFLGRPA